MGDTYACLHYHFVFSTKNRESWINPDLGGRIWEFLGGIARQNGLKPIIVGGMPDHIHMAVGSPPTVTLSKVVQQIKGGSSRWIKDLAPGLKGFGWQDGYAVFAVSKSNLPALTAYIENQREHHRKKTFKEEFVALLVRHGIDYDPRYLWD